MHSNSSKNYSELKSSYKDLKDQSEMSVGGVKPVMGNGTRWIDYKVRAMRRVVEKFGLYIQHLRDHSNDQTIK